MHFTIKKGTIEEAAALSRQIPEFENPYTAQEYHQRLNNVPHLILIAYDANKPVGFKVGYAREDYFYSWMGAVLLDYRRHKIAKQLADEQEMWARQQGFKKIRFKTWNARKEMLIFGISNGFNILSVEPKEQIEAYRIWLEKTL